MHTPASTKIEFFFLGVKWELGGRVAGLKLLLTFRASRICQIFGVSAASRPRQFQNQLGFRPRGLTSRAMRQRCGVASTSKAAPLAPYERLPLAAPPPASQSKAAASAACVDVGTTASSDIRGGDIRGGDIRGGDTQGGDIRGGDTQGGDIRGGDIRGSDIRGGDIRGSAHGIGRGRESKGRAGAQPGQGRKKRALAAAAECSWGRAYKRTFAPKLPQNYDIPPRYPKLLFFFNSSYFFCRK